MRDIELQQCIKKISKFTNHYKHALEIIFSKFIDHKKESDICKKDLYTRFIDLINNIKQLNNIIEADKKHECELLKKETILFEKIFTYIIKKIQLCDEEKKVIKILHIFLASMIKIFNNINLLDDCDEKNTNSTEQTDKKSSSHKSKLSSNHKKHSCKKKKVDSDDDHNNNKIVADCKNNDSVKNVKNLAKNLYKTMEFMKVLLILLDKEFTNQINQFNINGTNNITSNITIDFINKLLDIFFSQFSTVLYKHCDKTADSSKQYNIIYLMLDDKKYFKFCILDNIRINKTTQNLITLIAIETGDTKAVLQYGTKDKSVNNIITILKHNIDNIGIVLNILDANLSIIDSCLESIEKLGKLNLLNGDKINTYTIKTKQNGFNIQAKLSNNQTEIPKASEPSVQQSSKIMNVFMRNDDKTDKINAVEEKLDDMMIKPTIKKQTDKKSTKPKTKAKRHSRLHK